MLHSNDYLVYFRMRYLFSLVFLIKEFDHGVTQIISSIVDHIRQCFVKAVLWTQT